ncbi:hypothetical protein BGX34_005919, partial [Mortierella sp. NVP85]
ELGAPIMTIPMMGRGDLYLAPQSLLWTLIYQTLWVAVPWRLGTFTQGKVVTTFVGMMLDLFQSHTLIGLRQKQQSSSDATRTSVAGHEAMDIDSTLAPMSKAKQNNDSMTLQEQLERDAAVEPFRVILDQRSKELEPTTRDRLGFEGFEHARDKTVPREASTTFVAFAIPEVGAP